MRISLLEDNPEQQKLYGEILGTNTFISNDPQKILTTHPDLFILDLEINGDQNVGIKTAEQIRLLDKWVPIAFLTTHDELAIETLRHRVGAIDFIEKTTPDEIKNQLLKLVSYVSNLKDPDEFITINTRGFTSKIALDRILYAETSGNAHAILIHYDDGIAKVNMNMASFTKTSDIFMKIYQSYVINKKHAQSFNSKTNLLVMDNDDELDVGRRFKAEVQKLFE
ncbi:MAG: response regulator transcription factor [Lactobacillaceae bacterium]|jgi:two-component system response regulator AgrA|nr:response regulator transcription factor [Lactobacillaceae bacterium]